TQSEWAAAFVRDPQGEQRTLVPIRVSDCKPKGLLSSLIYVDLVGFSEQDARSAILGAFSSRAKPAQSPPFPGASDRVAPNPVPFPSVSVGGNVTDSVIVTGSGNTILNAPVQPRLRSQERRS